MTAISAKVQRRDGTSPSTRAAESGHLDAADRTAVAMVAIWRVGASSNEERMDPLPFNCSQSFVYERLRFGQHEETQGGIVEREFSAPATRPRAAAHLSRPSPPDA
jgi:hypothetical protein